MGKHRRSIAGGGSVRNKGDQPLSPPTTPIPYKRPSQSAQGVVGLYRLPTSSNSYYEGDDPAMLQHMLTMNLVGDLQPHGRETHGQQEDEEDPEKLPSEESAQEDASCPEEAVTPPSAPTPPTTDSEPKERPQLASATSLPEEGSLSENPLSASMRQIAHDEQRQARASLLAVGAMLGLFFLQVERLGLKNHQSLLPHLSGLVLALAALPPLCYAYMCWPRLPKENTPEANGNSAKGESSTDDLLSKCLSSKGMAAVLRAEGLQRQYGKWILKALACFAAFEVIRVYSFLWPFLHVPQLQNDYILRDAGQVPLPPVFAAAPPGMRVGLTGFPPRPSSLAASASDFGKATETRVPISTLQLLLPFLGGLLRLLGLRFCSKAFQAARPKDAETTKGVRRARLLGSLASLLFGAVPLFRLSLSWRCTQPYTGLLPLVGEAANEYAHVVLLVHSVLAAAGAAVAGSMLVAAASVVGQKASRRSSQILGMVAAVLLCGSLNLDAFAAVQHQGSECQYIHFISDMLNGGLIPKLMIVSGAIFGGLGLYFLSCSASGFGFRNRLLFKTLEGIPIDEEKDLYIKDKE